MLMRELNQRDSKFRAQPARVASKFLNQRVAILELSYMRDCLGEFDSEAKIVGNAIRPALPRGGAMPPMEGRVDLDAIEPCRIARKIGNAFTEVVAIYGWQRPSCGPDSYAHGRYLRAG